MSTPTPSGSLAESLFAAWLVQREAGEEPELDELCREEPQAAAELRELHSQWARVEALRRQCGLDGSLFARLETHYGSGVDPRVTLAGEEPVQGSFASEVLARLASQGPASARYRVQGEVAHGGMGAVLQVWDEDLRRHLAMKVMLRRGGGVEQGGAQQAEPRKLARFLEEAQVTGQLDHPGIVPVHELGLDAQGRVYFTMKLVRGRTLRAVFDELARGADGWTQTRVLGLLLKVCEAMSYAHAKGVIHRDLKPDNVMVGSFGEVYVMDWGLAKVLGREGATDVSPNAEPGAGAIQSERQERAEGEPDSPLYTRDGDVVGTPAYMPPEQALGDLGAMGAHSDVYSVGAMLYHLLAGNMPYARAGERAGSFGVWRRVREGPPAALDRVAAGAPAELVAICERAMAREPARRYRDMAQLAADLSAYLEGRVVGAYETGAWAEARKWVQRNAGLATALAMAAVLAVGGLGGIGYVQTRGREAERVQRERADAKAGEAERNAQEARANLALAQENERLARAETAKVLRLSDVKVLRELEVRAENLWPPHPDQIPAMDAWLAAARTLVGTVTGHRATLAQMRAGAGPWSEQERARDRATHPRAGELAQREAELAALVAELERSPSGLADAQAERRLAELEQEVSDLAEAVQSRRIWRFGGAELQWQHDVLVELVEGLGRFEAQLLAGDAIGPVHGWSVTRRRTFAQELQEGFAEGGAADAAWHAALPSLRAAYPGLELATQMGLLPLGPDPESGLWEFAHLMTGEPAERGPDGRLVLTEGTGVVLVLLRGGRFWMGAQGSDPAGANFDPQARSDEGPAHEVELSPFFISKYELTQGQWERLTSVNPSVYKLGRAASSLLHPVEQVSWLDCSLWLSRASLTLPSEAQWEYAARAGTQTPWWTGRERESLRERRAANLADQAAGRTGVNWPAIEEWPELDDGYAAHAPIGTYAPNPFGLHEVAGNLWEWTLDGYDAGYYGRSPELDPVSPGDGSNSRVNRGGSFAYPAPAARSSSRLTATSALADVSLGVRPARAIERR